MVAKTARNLHVPLLGPVHDRLRAEATRAGRPATALAREAIEARIAERERHAQHESIVEYASEMAGSGADLDDDLEKAGFNQVLARRSIIVIPLSTSLAQRRRGPTAILVQKKGTAGLRQESVALCHQVTTLDRSTLTDRIGELPTASLQRVSEGLRAALALL